MINPNSKYNMKAKVIISLVVIGMIPVTAFSQPPTPPTPPPVPEGTQRYEETASSRPVSGTSADLVAALRDLSNKHAAGLLNDQEFAAAKARVLGD